MPRQRGPLDQCQNIFQAIEAIKDLLPWINTVAECLGNMPSQRRRQGIISLAHRLYPDNRAERERFYHSVNAMLDAHHKATLKMVDAEIRAMSSQDDELDQTGVD